MQKDPLIAAMVGALLLGSVAILVLGIGFHYQSRQIRGLQTQLLAIQNTRMMTEALANDVVEYSKRNPAIDPILQQAGIKPAGRPAAK